MKQFLRLLLACAWVISGAIYIPIPRTDEGQLTFLPEPESAALGIAAAAAIAGRAARARC